MNGNDIRMPEGPEPAGIPGPNSPARYCTTAESPVTRTSALTLPAGKTEPIKPVPPPGQRPPAPGRSGAGFRWFLILVLGLCLVCGISAVYYLVVSAGTHGIAVVRMEGTMVTGEADDADAIGSEVVGSLLREAADDPMVEAIVIRVDSPGGSPAAAQEIIGDLEYAKTKKPVVVSMGDMATSAAYYVSAHADRIYADPDTFTAGVGVLWKFSDISNWMQKEGYNLTVIKSGSKKDMGSTARPISDEEQVYAQKLVTESFEDFISDVTTQRAISRSDIEDGRVIRGADALTINVIDELGNLNDAIDGAKRLAQSRSKSSIPGLLS